MRPSRKIPFIIGIGVILSAMAIFAVASNSSQAEISDSPILDYLLHLQRGDYITYTDPIHGLSFDIPKDFVVSKFDDNGREVVLAESPRFKLGLQLVITPFDEEEPITADRIRQDLPSLVMEMPVEFWVDDATPAVRFTSEDPSLGETREIWFARDGNLYQFTLYCEDPRRLDALIRQFATDFKFGTNQPSPQESLPK